ncbi:MAG: cyclic nucleotide-binding domain-containing protein [Gammaproteobacteria bacterium]|nr:cyclic nucleotide-binding domain-containing protein [Gammaproteobacteria bacterium]
MKTISALLHEHPFTQGLEETILELIAGCAKNVVFQAGEYLLREGQNAEQFFLIRHGTVALEMFAPGGGTITFLTVKSGEILGSNWLLPPYQWSYDARAVELTRAIAFECRCLRDKCESDHHVGYEMMKRFIPPLVERLQAARLQSANLYAQPKS